MHNKKTCIQIILIFVKKKQTNDFDEEHEFK